LTDINKDYYSWRVSISEYPQIIDIHDGGEVTVGDLHGNALKFIHTLIMHEFVQGIDEEEYNEFVEIYQTKTRRLDARSLERFSEIISQMELKSPNKNSLLRLLGDDLADRGENDYFTLLIFKRLNEINLNYEIINSNHSFEFMRAYERENRNVGAFSRYWTTVKPINSMQNLIQLIRNKLVDINEVKEIIESAYKPKCKLLSYTFNQDVDQITIYSHAPIDISIIQQVAIVIESNT